MELHLEITSAKTDFFEIHGCAGLFQYGLVFYTLLVYEDVLIVDFQTLRS